MKGSIKATSGIFILLALLFYKCKSEPDPQVSFYYWKTIFSLSKEEKQVLKVNGVTKLYIRYFDIILSKKTKKPVPESPVIFKQKTTDLLVVPVVYIKNEVFLNRDIDIKDLAIKTHNYIEQINKFSGIESSEIQVDCDWTLTSRDKYMEFIRLLKSVSNKILSATIRLHQVKYAYQTKVPEVDYGVLMYYNMGKLDANSTNSIYDRSVALKYLGQLKAYPLTLKVALPIFSWGVQVRNNRIIKVISKLDIESFEEDTNFVTKGNFVYVKTSMLRFGNYFKQGDKIRIENVSSKELEQMEDDLSSNMKNHPEEIIFYDLDSVNLNRYENGIFEKMAHCF